MSYLLDRKIKRKRFSYVLFFVAFLLVMFYLGSGIWSGLSVMSQAVFRPVLVVGGNIGGKFSSIGSYFASKSSLSKENESLKRELEEARAAMVNYDSISAENISLKEILERKDASTPLILAAILSKPNKSPYDTIIIDAGEARGLKKDDIVFARGNVPIGKISAVYPSSSKVVLFSTNLVRTQVVTPDKNIFLEAVGRGGGNFEVVMPRDLTLSKGDELTLPGITPYVLGVVETIISDPRDPFAKALLVSPVNIQELKFVEVSVAR